MLAGLAGVAAAEETYTFKFGHSMSEQSARHQSMLKFKELVEAASDGRIKVEIYANGLLGSEAEMMDMVAMNVIQGTAGSQFAKANPEYLIYQMPFMFESTDEFQAVLNSDFEKKIAAGAAANGFYIPTTGIAGGFREITNNIRPIVTVEDMAGLKLRVPGLTPVVRTIEALGANPTEISYNETYMSLSTGVVDGQENPPSNIVDMKFYEVQKYMTIVDYIICPECFFTNNDWYMSLPDDLKAIFDECAVESMQYRTDTWLASENACIDTISQHCEVNTLTAENRAAFREKCLPVWQQFVSTALYQEDLTADRAAGRHARVNRFSRRELCAEMPRALPPFQKAVIALRVSKRERRAERLLAVLYGAGVFLLFLMICVRVPSCLSAGSSIYGLSENHQLPCSCISRAWRGQRIRFDQDVGSTFLPARRPRCVTPCAFSACWSTVVQGFLFYLSFQWIAKVGGYLTPLLRFPQRWAQAAIPIGMGLGIVMCVVCMLLGYDRLEKKEIHC
jgi:C4-dicarboxylate-binding protein DctP